MTVASRSGARAEGRAAARRAHGALSEVFRHLSPRAPNMSPEIPDRTVIADRIRTFLSEEYAAQGIELTDTTNLLDEYFVDSFGIIDTVMFLENAFGIRIEQNDINGENFRDVTSLSAFVHGRLTEGAS